MSSSPPVSRRPPVRPAVNPVSAATVIPVTTELAQQAAAVMGRLEDMLNAGGHPPHRELDTENPEDQSGVAFEQAVNGVRLYYKRWQSVASAYEIYQASLAGRQTPPIIPWPTTVLNSNGKMEPYELDLNRAVPDGLTEDERVAYLQQMLGMLNNVFVRDYEACLRKLVQSATQALALMTGEGG